MDWRWASAGGAGHIVSPRAQLVVIIFIFHFTNILCSAVVRLITLAQAAKVYAVMSPPLIVGVLCDGAV